MKTVTRKARGPTDGWNRWLNGEKTGLNVKQPQYGIKRELHSGSVMKVTRKIGNFTCYHGNPYNASVKSKGAALPGLS